MHSVCSWCTRRSACRFGPPLNPQHFPNVSADSAFDTAVSFVTNTNWQGYAGESTMSYFTQMLALAVQNFFSPATGISVAFALIRGFSRRSAAGRRQFLGGRHAQHALHPAATVIDSRRRIHGPGRYSEFQCLPRGDDAGECELRKPQTRTSGNPLKDAAGNPITEPATTQTQTLPMGPVASQEAIKMVGTNGGGFFNANSAHPFENPTPLTISCK